MKNFKQVITYLVIMTLVVGMIPTNGYVFAEEQETVIENQQPVVEASEEKTQDDGIAPSDNETQEGEATQNGDPTPVVETSNENGQEQAKDKEKDEAQPEVKKIEDAQVPKAVPANDLTEKEEKDKVVVVDLGTKEAAKATTVNTVQNLTVEVATEFGDSDLEATTDVNGVSVAYDKETKLVTFTIEASVSPKMIEAVVSNETQRQIIRLTVTDYYNRNLAVSKETYKDLNVSENGLSSKFYKLTIKEDQFGDIPSNKDDIFGIDKHNTTATYTLVPNVDSQGTMDAMKKAYDEAFNDNYNDKSAGNETVAFGRGLYFYSDGADGTNNGHGDVYYQGMVIKGYFIPLNNGFYKFGAMHDDGIYFTIGDENTSTSVVADLWAGHSPNITEMENYRYMEAGTAYPVTVKFFENKYSGAALALKYQYKATDDSEVSINIAIPEKELFPTTETKDFPDRRQLVINLKGEANVDVIMGEDYKDAGVTYTPEDQDETLLNITSSTTINFIKSNGDKEVVTEIDEYQLGKYEIVYNAKNAYSTATPVTRTVNVIPGEDDDFVYIMNNSNDLYKYLPYVKESDLYGKTELKHYDVLPGGIQSIATFKNGRVLGTSNGNKMYIDIDLGADKRSEVTFTKPVADGLINSLAIDDNDTIYFACGTKVYSAKMRSSVESTDNGLVPVYEIPNSREIANLDTFTTIGDLQVVNGHLYGLLHNGSEYGLYIINSGNQVKELKLHVADSSFGLAATRAHQFIGSSNGEMTALNRGNDKEFLTEFNNVVLGQNEDNQSYNLFDAARGIERKEVVEDYNEKMAVYEGQTIDLFGPTMNFAGYDVTYVYNNQYITINETNGTVTGNIHGAFDDKLSTNVKVYVHDGEGTILDMTIDLLDQYYTLSYTGGTNVTIPDKAAGQANYQPGYVLTSNMDGSTGSFISPKWEVNDKVVENTSFAFDYLLTNGTKRVYEVSGTTQAGFDVRYLTEKHEVTFNRGPIVYTLEITPVDDIDVPIFGQDAKTGSFEYSFTNNYDDDLTLNNAKWSMPSADGITLANGGYSVNNVAKNGTNLVTLSGKSSLDQSDVSATVNLTTVREKLVWKLSINPMNPLIIPTEGTNSALVSYVLDNQYEHGLPLTNPVWSVVTEHDETGFRTNKDGLVEFYVNAEAKKYIEDIEVATTEGVNVQLTGDELVGLNPAGAVFHIALAALAPQVNLQAPASITVLPNSDVVKDVAVTYVDQYGFEHALNLDDAVWSVSDVDGVSVSNGPEMAEKLTVETKTQAESITLTFAKGNDSYSQEIALVYNYEYKMDAIDGVDSVTIPANKKKNVKKTYTSKLTNNYEHDMSNVDIDFYLIDGNFDETAGIVEKAYTNVTIDKQGNLLVKGGNQTYQGDVTILAIAEKEDGFYAYNTKTVTIKRAESKFRAIVAGSKSIIIPTDGEVKKNYKASVKDQYGVGADFDSLPTWSVLDSNKKATNLVSIDNNGVLTVDIEALKLLEGDNTKTHVFVKVSGQVNGKTVAKIKKVNLIKEDTALSLSINPIPMIVKPSEGVVAEIQLTYTLKNEYGEDLVITEAEWYLDDEIEGVTLTDNGLLRVDSTATAQSIPVHLSGSSNVADNTVVIETLNLNIEGPNGIVVPGLEEDAVTKGYQFDLRPSSIQPNAKLASDDEPMNPEEILTTTFVVAEETQGVSAQLVDVLNGSVTVTSATQSKGVEVQATMTFIGEVSNADVFIAEGTKFTANKAIELLYESRLNSMAITGPTPIDIPRSGERNTSATYVLNGFDQYNKVFDISDMSIMNLTRSYPGVTFDNETGILIVSSAASPQTITLVGTLKNDDELERNDMNVDTVFYKVVLRSKPPVGPTPVVTNNLTIDVVGQGTVTPLVSNYAPGATATLVVTPNEGWEFVGFTGPVDANNQIVMDQDYAITATFEEIVIPEEDTPLANPDPQPTEEEEEEIIDIEENETPLAELPQTGGIDSIFFYLIGGLFILLGSRVSYRQSKSHN